LEFQKTKISFTIKERKKYKNQHGNVRNPGESFKNKLRRRANIFASHLSRRCITSRPLSNH